MYVNFDLKETINRLPPDFFPARQNEFIQSLKGKTGVIELVSNDTDTKRTKLKVNYSYASGDNSAKHLLDLINALYVVYK
jgi:hypothetical protein